jgi:Rps23 Pro-64 3,4-dihydroxylase Tpa1-like proline 4-hydroxylase
MQVHDKAIPDGIAEATRGWLMSQSMLHGWRAHAGAPGCFWHRNFVLPGTYEHHYDEGAWSPRLSYSALCDQRSPLAAVAEIVRHRFLDGVEPTRVWANFQTFGDESAFHRDFPEQFRGRARSVVWYPVEAWERDWGGDFVTLDEQGEIDDCVMIRPNRLVVFDGTTSHAARPISRYCNALRIAVSIATEVIR